MYFFYSQDFPSSFLLTHNAHRDEAVPHLAQFAQRYEHRLDVDHDVAAHSRRYHRTSFRRRINGRIQAAQMERLRRANW